MSRTSMNIGEVLRQLGITDINELPIAEAVQPTISLGDASAITPALIPPTAYAGGAVAGDGSTTYGGVRVRAAPSGTFIRQINASSTATSTIRFRVIPIADALTYATGPTARTMMNVGHEDSRSSVDIFTVLAAGVPSTADTPGFTNAAGVSDALADLIYLPSGYIYEMWIGSFTLYLNFYVVVQDAVPNLTPSG